MNKMGIAKKLHGMTLVEILIALILGIFLIAGVIQIFLGSKQTYRMQENLARLQENGRFAMDFISRDIRIADYWGCLRNGLTDVSNNNKALYGIPNSIIGVEGSSNAPDGVALAGVAGGESAAVLSQASVSGNITVAAGNQLKVGDVALISDCNQGDLFTINGISGGTVIAQNVSGGQDITKIYGADASIYPLSVSIYFIQNSVGSGRPALFRTRNGVTNELVEGIEDMQILYGEDTNGDNSSDYFVPADQVVDMNRVVSIRVSLLVVTLEDNLATESVSYTFNGATTTPTDKRMRRIFSSTVAVRNRLP